MYWYYFQSARGIRIWWKEWITRLQIVQFVIDLGTSRLHSDLQSILFLAVCTVDPASTPLLTSFVSFSLLAFVYFASYTYFSSTYFPRLPTAGRCAGEEFAAFAGMGIISSYLLLFISFYLATYKKQAARKGRKRSMSEMGKKAAIDMSKLEVPTVDKAIHGSAAVNGSATMSMQNGNATNGSVKRESTRSRKG